LSEDIYEEAKKRLSAIGAVPATTPDQ